jgi:hypothetical protein
MDTRTVPAAILRGAQERAPQDDGEQVRRPESGTFLNGEDYFAATGRSNMARKYSKKASADVERVMKKRKAGTLKSGRSGKKVTSRKQAIAIGLSEARKAGAHIPKKKARKRAA